MMSSRLAVAYRWHWTFGLALVGALVAPAMGWTDAVPHPGFLPDDLEWATPVNETIAALVERLTR